MVSDSNILCLDLFSSAIFIYPDHYLSNIRMAIHYYQPDIASYNMALPNLLHQCEHHICDQCGTVETPAVRFRLCGGYISGNTTYFIYHNYFSFDHLVDCPILHMFMTLCYCTILLTQLHQSQECQKIHWPSHRAICQHLSAQSVEQTKEYVGGEALVKYLCRFSSTYSSLLG